MKVKTTKKTAQRNKPRNKEAGSLHVNLRPNDIMPPTVIKTLNYIDSVYVRNVIGTNYFVYSFRVNDLWDPDPLVLSGSVSGFKELMQFYSYYRVNHVSVSFKLFNNEAFAILYGAVFSQTNLTGVISSRDDAVNALENDFSTRARIISAKGGLDHDDINFELNLYELLGDKKQYEAEASYTGLGSASPSTPLWLNFIAASPTGTALANGYTHATTLSMTAKFFGRTNLRA